MTRILNKPPTVPSLQDGIARLERARTHVAQADFQPIVDGFSAFVEPSLSDRERRTKLGAASGDPLTDAVFELLQAFAESTPEGALEGAVREATDALKPNGELRESLRTHWFGPFLEADMSVAGEDLERLRVAITQPGFRAKLHDALDIVRVAGRVEAHNLERIAAHVPPEKQGEVLKVLSNFGLRAVGLAAETIARAPGDDGQALIELAANLGKLLSTNEDCSPLERGQVVAQVVSAASNLSRDPTGLHSVAVRSARVPRSAQRALSDELSSLSEVAKSDLQAAGLSLAPGADVAIKDLVDDLEATAVTMTQLARMAGAVANPHMSEAERARAIKTAAEDMGPIFVKLLQTVAHQDAILKPVLTQYAGGPGGSKLVLDTLKTLQSEVTPMPFADVRFQVESQLGKKLEDVFIAFDPDPIGSASIGQVHVAKIPRGDGPGEMEVVVKVQRLGLEEEFERTARVAGLSIDLLGEMVKTLGNSGAFGRDTAALKGLLASLDGTLGGFIDSFRVEMDYGVEAQNMETFRLASKSQRFVTCPKVYPAFSSEKVLTQRFMRGYPLVELLDRAVIARDAPAVPTQKLPDGDAGRAEAARRGAAFAVANLGLPASSIEVTPSSRGFKVELNFDDKVTPRAAIEIRHSGTIERLSNFMDLSSDNLVQLRDRIISNFISQALVYGVLHGDLHQGNFLVMRDAKTLALIDFGNVVTMSARELKAFGNLALAIYSQDPKKIAQATFGLSRQAGELSNQDREKVEDHLSEIVADAVQGKSGSLTPEDFLQILTLATVEVGIEIAPSALQTVKTTVAMLGSVDAFMGHGFGFDSPVAAGIRIAGGVLGEAASTLNPMRGRHQAQKDAHEDALLS